MALSLVDLGTPARTRAAWWALAAAVVAAIGSGLSWRLKAHDNSLIRAGQAMTVAELRELDKTPPALVFAQAHQLAADEQLEPSLARYRALYGLPDFAIAARYNSANLLLRQGLALRETDAGAQALPLIELAKQGYRDVLRADPGHWDARYNFERAQRAQPDPDEIDAPIGEPRAQPERSPTTTRGVGGGLP